MRLDYVSPMRAPIDVDRMAGLAYFSCALIATASFLGAGAIDDGAVGVADVGLALLPLTAFVAWLLTRPEKAQASLEDTAVAVLTAQATDPTVDGRDPISRAAARLMTAIGETERREAEDELARLLER